MVPNSEKGGVGLIPVSSKNSLWARQIFQPFSKKGKLVYAKVQDVGGSIVFALQKILKIKRDPVALSSDSHTGGNDSYVWRLLIHGVNMKHICSL